MKIEEFENIFGNVPFEELKKINKYITDNYIEKSKVIEKIEEIHNEPMNYSVDEYWLENECIDKLQELLEERN